MSRAVLCVFAAVAFCALAQGFAHPPPPKPTLVQKVEHAKEVVGEKLHHAKLVAGAQLHHAKEVVGAKIQHAKEVIGDKVNHVRQVVADAIAPKNGKPHHLLGLKAHHH